MKLGEQAMVNLEIEAVKDALERTLRGHSTKA